MPGGTHLRDGLPPASILAARLRGPLGERAVDVPAPGERAAVVIVLHDVGGRPHTLLTRRADHLVHHPGQVSLPGGRHDPEDPTLADTALRELHEELGIAPEAVDLVCRLDDVHTMVSGFLVTPFVAHAVGPLRPVPSDAEIARVMLVPLDAILAADRLLPPRPTVATLRYPLDGEDVWGATARILRLFVERLDAALTPDAG